MRIKQRAQLTSNNLERPQQTPRARQLSLQLIIQLRNQLLNYVQFAYNFVYILVYNLIALHDKLHVLFDNDLHRVHHAEIFFACGCLLDCFLVILVVGKTFSCPSCVSESVCLQQETRTRLRAYTHVKRTHFYTHAHSHFMTLVTLLLSYFLLMTILTTSSIGPSRSFGCVVPL